MLWQSCKGLWCCVQIGQGGPEPLAFKELKGVCSLAPSKSQ